MRYFRLSSFFFLAAAVVTAGDPTVRTGVRTNTTWSQLLVAGVNAQLQSRHADAVVSYESAIAAREELLAHDDPLIAVVLNNIADLDLF